MSLTAARDSSGPYSKPSGAVHNVKLTRLFAQEKS